MPRVRVMTSVASADFAYGAGDEVDMPVERAQEFLRAGWGVLVREEAPETPEEPAGRAVPGPETPEGAPRRAVRRQKPGHRG